jgi:cell division septum initiation protein DivIVA
MSEKSWKQIREELKMLLRQMCVTPVDEALEYIDDILKLQEQLQSAHQEIERLEQERDKLIECLRFYERLARGREVNDGGRRARTLLAEIGVTVE